MEEIDDAWDFLVAPKNDLLAIHKYNTKIGQHCVVFFSVNLVMKWFVEITKVYQLGILSNFLVLHTDNQRVGEALLFT